MSRPCHRWIDCRRYKRFRPICSRTCTTWCAHHWLFVRIRDCCFLISCLFKSDGIPSISNPLFSFCSLLLRLFGCFFPFLVKELSFYTLRLFNPFHLFRLHFFFCSLEFSGDSLVFLRFDGVHLCTASAVATSLCHISQCSLSASHCFCCLVEDLLQAFIAISVLFAGYNFGIDGFDYSFGSG